MAPKSLFLLIGFSLLFFPNIVFGYSDSELTQMYRGNTDNDTMNNIVNAINSGKLQCADLPPNIIITQCPQSTQQFQQLQNNVTNILHPNEENTQNPNTVPPLPTTTSSANSQMDMLIPLILILIIIMAVVIVISKLLISGGPSLPRFKHKIIQKGQIQNKKHFKTNRTLPKGFIKPEHDEQPTIDIHLGQKILLMLGMLKVKKNE